MEGAVRVTIIRTGGEEIVGAVRGGRAGVRQGCAWSLVYAPELEDAPYGISPGPKPHPDAQFALLLCNGTIVQPIWVAPDDIIDLDGLARDEAQRYIEDVLVPVIGIGVNPAARGLVGLDSWFWVEGFDGAGHGTADHRVRAHHRGPHVVRVGDLGLRRRRVDRG